MGTKLTITKDDVNSSKLVVGWFEGEVVKYEESPASDRAKNPGSLNRNFEFRVTEGDAQGVRLRTTFNEVFAPLLPEFVAAIGGEYSEGKVYDLEDAVGRKIRIHVKRGEYNGRPTNEVDGFRSVS